MSSVKIFDTTAVIAFLSEMDFSEGIVELSKHYEIIIPEGVVAEVKKPPGKEMLQRLMKQKTVKIVTADPVRVKQIIKEYPQLHIGECEVITIVQMHDVRRKDCIVSDDLSVRKKFQTLNIKGTEKLLYIMRKEGIIDDETHILKSHKLQNSTFYPAKRNHYDIFGCGTSFKR